MERAAGATLSLMVPPSLPIADFDALAASLLSLAAAFRVALVGGNISRSPGPLVVDVAAFGTVAPRRVLKRAGARPGDELWLTGTAGDAAAGLGACSAGHRDGDATYGESIARFLRPEPRVRMGSSWAGRRGQAPASTRATVSEPIAQLVEAPASAALSKPASVRYHSARSWFEPRAGSGIVRGCRRRRLRASLRGPAAQTPRIPRGSKARKGPGHPDWCGHERFLPRPEARGARRAGAGRLCPLLMTPPLFVSP